MLAVEKIRCKKHYPSRFLYDSVGEVQSFYRLFMAPGMAHCDGGPGPNSFDMQAMEQRVERGSAPESIIVRTPMA